MNTTMQETKIPRRLKLNRVPNNCKILYYVENEIIIIDKPCDIKIGRGGSLNEINNNNNDNETTVDKLIYKMIKEKRDNNGDLMVDKIRWIHRLDMATSGVLCVGLSKASSRLINSLFDERKVKKLYIAIIRGNLKRKDKEEKLLQKRDIPTFPEFFLGKRKRNLKKEELIFNRTFWTFDEDENQEVLYIDKNIVVQDSFKMATASSRTTITSINNNNNNNKRLGRISRTKVFVLKYLNIEGIKCTKVALIPETGRRHQLRVHLNSIGHPILGDWTYDREFCIKKDLKRMYLHSKRLTIPVKDYKYINHRGKCKGLKIAKEDKIDIEIELDPF